MNLAQMGLVKDRRGRIDRPEKSIVDILAEGDDTAPDYGFGVLEQFDKAMLVTMSNLSVKLDSRTLESASPIARSGPKKKRSRKPALTTHTFRQEAKKKLGLMDIDYDIREMDLKTLRSYFGYKNGKIKTGLFCRNVAWQCLRFTKAGNPPDFVVRGGNIRSLKYYVKTITARHSVSFGKNTDFDSNFTAALSDLTSAGLMSYTDLNFIDSNKVNRWVAPSYGAKNVIAIAEKRSFSEELLSVGKKLGVTVQCTGGSSSRVTVETMLLEMAEKGHDLTKPFVVFAMVDFDPSGWNIADEFVEQMLELGLGKVRSFWPYGRDKPKQPWIDIVSVKDLDPELIDHERHNLKAGRKNLTNEWLTATGGLYGRGGKKWGLSSEAFLGMLEEHLSSKLDKYLPADYLYHKIEALRSLAQPLKDYVSTKLFA